MTSVLTATWLYTLIQYVLLTVQSQNVTCIHIFMATMNKNHLKNVGPIRHNEPPHVHSADVAIGTVARRLRVDVHDDIDNDNA